MEFRCAPVSSFLEELHDGKRVSRQVALLALGFYVLFFRSAALGRSRFLFR